ncbi:gliding motility-associated C-terminal domain-containing protein [Echinicola strongylocentroti]|uniref:Gliding motility-associated C-terminal domain-containing protein n=1 Tax=Echinicola strongylocentroti TaxID=1795355 RepID=A0A2Z4IPS2_9BACT|nr:gliding motility-associated C-terminal domain-containing protein [Echinicola strongylocentroti]AWW32293.1 gliding motility-associated C-terminal domain-containing protein [Echinicola strongylocentroti]
MKCKAFLLLSTILFFIGLQQSMATHIRAGEIIAERISTQSLTYRITVVGYTDTRSSVVFGPGRIEFGDGRVVENLNTESEFSTVESLGNQIEKNVFVITHTYQGPGEYTIRFQEFNRNDLTLNMDNSVETPFYIETMITIDPFVGVNNSPVLTIPPVDNGQINTRYIHNPGAYDPDGDSIAYRFDDVVPLQDFQRPVGNYRSPASDEFSFNREDGSPNPYISMDPLTGDLIWDAPGIAGQYNVAFHIEEWRKIDGKYEKIGYVVRDMQIIIENSDNQRPQLQVPEDLCVIAGENIEEIIQGSDPDGDDVKIEVFGDPIEISSSPASYNPEETYQSSPGIVNFDWQTVCNHVRSREYQVRIRITDDPESGPALVDIKTWNIRVIGPPPVIQSVDQDVGRSAAINWDPYSCGNSAESMQIWRSVNSNPYTPDSCETGIRDGYELIGTTDMQTFEFLDDNDGEGLAPGNTYCYRLVAVYPQPRGGESKVSEEFCLTIDVDVPIITNVSIEETDPENGEVFVKWTPPYDIDTQQYPGPYEYQLIRSEGFSGDENIQPLTTTNDTLFTDTGLNTEGLVYNYKVVLFDGGQAIDTSSVASSVWLQPTIINEAIELNWEFNVPWNNNISQYTHEVYRNRTDPDASDADTFELIAEVDVSADGFTFLDDGSHNGVPLSRETEYCYYVVTKGAYNVDMLTYPLENKSQIICARPDDNRLPCPPVLTFDGPVCEELLANEDCNFSAFYHDLSWEPDFSGDCDDELGSFNIYFSPTGDEGTFELISTESSLSREATITELEDYKGCYYITAVDRSGNESEPSNIVCVDNCPNYELPNAFTPNGDGTNDTFMAFDNPFPRCPRFVEAVEITIYNRWGSLVFEYNSATSNENDIYIRWDGRDQNGNDLPAGTYFYSATVLYDTNDESAGQEELKGHIQIIK